MPDVPKINIGPDALCEAYYEHLHENYHGNCDCEMRACIKETLRKEYHNTAHAPDYAIKLPVNVLDVLEEIAKDLHNVK